MARPRVAGETIGRAPTSLRRTVLTLLAPESRIRPSETRGELRSGLHAPEQESTIRSRNFVHAMNGIQRNLERNTQSHREHRIEYRRISLRLVARDTRYAVGSRHAALRRNPPRYLDRLHARDGRCDPCRTPRS